MSKPPKPQDIAKQLRAAIAQAERDGLTRYKIAKAAGIDPSQVGRVADGEIIPKLDTAEKIAAAIGLRIRIG